MGFFLLGWFVPDWLVIAFLPTVLLTVAARRTLEWIWFKPKRLEKILREQGIRGNPYKPMLGDIRDHLRMLSEALSKPLPLYSHDIGPRVVPSILQITKDYGKNSLTWFGTTPRVIVYDPELIRVILSSKLEQFDVIKANAFLELFVKGLVSYVGKKWIKHRRIISPSFHMEKVKYMLPAFSECCSTLLGRWEMLVGSEVPTEVDVWPEFQNLTRDVLSKTAFSSSYKEGSLIFKLQEEQTVLLVKNLQYVTIPGYRFLPTRDNRRMKQINREVHDLLKAMIERREKTMREGNITDDLLGNLMQSNFRYSQENENSQEMGMSIEDVIEECKLFYIAGQVTTNTLLTWVMLLLSMYPKWQDQAREEVIRIFGKDKPDYHGLNHLNIVTMIIHETLRLYPPVPYTIRKAGNVELGKYTLPEGVEAIIPTLLVHRDPEYWGKDADEFNPERFSEGVSKASTGHMSFLPFSAGRRVCVGQGFAMLEAKLVLSMILQRFSFTISPSYVHSPHNTIVVCPQQGAPIMLTRI